MTDIINIYGDLLGKWGQEKIKKETEDLRRHARAKSELDRIPRPFFPGVIPKRINPFQPPPRKYPKVDISPPPPLIPDPDTGLNWPDPGYEEKTWRDPKGEKLSPDLGPLPDYESKMAQTPGIGQKPMHIFLNPERRLVVPDAINVQVT